MTADCLPLRPPPVSPLTSLPSMTVLPLSTMVTVSPRIVTSIVCHSPGAFEALVLGAWRL